MKINDVILRTVTKAVVFIILTLGVYLFFAGHHAQVVALLVASC